MAFAHIRNCLDGRRMVADIQCDAFHSRPVADLLDNLRDALLRDINGNYGRAFGVQPLNGSRTNAAACSRHQDNFALKSLHACSSMAANPCRGKLV
ncbi:hypothetical protein CUJ84_Chr003569 [Rhizobium leguminosarum]|uniref:Uncharacterized protein n=1 Tax=Rhizobium leguminosarum TaxID=384 RepID=A0A2K9Z6N9_RHILE|nr:hypothetical protein CUJ84_Chr003569 [Rhizobium leguminosarum]